MRTRPLVRAGHVEVGAERGHVGRARAGWRAHRPHRPARRPRARSRRWPRTSGAVPIALLAAVTATSRVRSLTSSRVLLGRQLAGRRVELGPPHGRPRPAPAACTHGRTLASWSSRDTTTSSPGRQPVAERPRDQVGQRGRARPEHHAARVPADQVGHGGAGLRRRCAAPGGPGANAVVLLADGRAGDRGDRVGLPAATSGAGRPRRSARSPRRRAGYAPGRGRCRRSWPHATPRAGARKTDAVSDSDSIWAAGLVGSLGRRGGWDTEGARRGQTRRGHARTSISIGPASPGSTTTSSAARTTSRSTGEAASSCSQAAPGRRRASCGPTGRSCAASVRFLVDAGDAPVPRHRLRHPDRRQRARGRPAGRPGRAGGLRRHRPGRGRRTAGRCWRQRPRPRSSGPTCATPTRSSATPEVRRLIDFDQPVGLLLVSVLHFMPTTGRPAGGGGRLRDAMPAGQLPRHLPRRPRRPGRARRRSRSASCTSRPRSRAGPHARRRSRLLRRLRTGRAGTGVPAAVAAGLPGRDRRSPRVFPVFAGVGQKPWMTDATGVGPEMRRFMPRSGPAAFAHAWRGQLIASSRRSVVTKVSTPEMRVRSWSAVRRLADAPATRSIRPRAAGSGPD